MTAIDSSKDFLLAADLVLAAHVLFVSFIIFGLIFIFVGKIRSWSWVRNPWFRLLHLLAICGVVLQTWLGIVCPLTVIENALRTQAGDTVYGGSFISYWLGTILYYQFPGWVFTVSYTVFAAAVIYSWFLVPPHSFKISNNH